MPDAHRAEDTQRQDVILTPDQRLRVFVSSTVQELATERAAAKKAILELRFAPVMFELGARAHPPRELYRSYLEQSHVFLGIYWQRYGWVAPGEEISGLEDEYQLAGNRPKLIYIKTPAPEREDRLTALLGRIRDDDQAAYRPFSTARELQRLIENDLAVLLTERFLAGRPEADAPDVRAEMNLPHPMTPLLGREQDMAALRVRMREARLVTLTGPGGVGKTRLALQLALESGDRFADGVFLVRLESVSDPELVVSSVAQTLGLLEAGRPPLLGTLNDFLGDREILLLLDNFEQVVAAAPLLAELLAHCPRLGLLVTSREVLNLSAERAYPVAPLELPQADAPLEALPQSGAVALFLERAQAVRPSFALTPENGAAVAELCIRLDGLPLALELAAARIKLFSPQALLSRLGRDLALLSGGARDLPDRQRTLAATVGWSYDLLAPPEQRLFGHLSAFVGGATVTAIEGVFSGRALGYGKNDPGEADPLEGVASLLDKSLLRREDSQDEPRFLMMQTIRTFAQGRLEERGEADAAQRAHAGYFLELAEAAEPHLRGAEQALWLTRLESEHGNLRAALAWAAQQGEAALGLRLAGALWRFWYMRGYGSEGHGWLTRLLALAPTRDAALAKALHGAGVLAHATGEDARAKALALESLALHRELGDEAGTAFALNNLGVMTYGQSDYTEARAHHEEALAIRRGLGDRSAVAHSLLNLGNVLSDQGDTAAALGRYQESLALSRASGDQGNAASALLNLGNLAYDADDLERAQARYRESLAISRELGDKAGIAFALSNLGNIHKDQGDYAAARALYQEALELRRGLADRWGVAATLLNLGIAAHDEGDLGLAARHYRESLLALRALGDKWRVLYLLEAFARLALAAGDAARSARLLGAATALRSDLGIPIPMPARAPRDEALAAARASLDPSSFAAAWAVGEALSLAEATLDALEQG